MPCMSKTLTVLGIETSCDETAAAVLRLTDGRAELLSDVIRTQLEEHAPYLGVVPEIAARAHAELADLTVKAAMHESGVSYSELDGVAATSGPGLIGGVLVGMMTGKAIAQAASKPFVAVNHLEGHALSPRLGNDCPFPYLLLLVSGGHCQFLEVRVLASIAGSARRLMTPSEKRSTRRPRHLALAFRAALQLSGWRKAGMRRPLTCPAPCLTGRDWT